MAISICEVHTAQNHKDTTLHGYVDFPVACYEDDMQLINVPVHWHDEYEYISNSVLMDLLHCSESNLLRYFKQVLGITPMKYLMNIRIQKAAEMLVTTDLRSSDIAIACGFHDFSYFTKVFRQNIGLTPAKYRNYRNC